MKDYERSRHPKEAATDKNDELVHRSCVTGEEAYVI